MTAPAVRVARRPVFRLLEPWRTRVLWASLAVNLVALPWLAVPHLWRPRPPGPPGFDMLVDRFAHPLPGPDQLRFREAMAHERPWFDASRHDIGDKRAAVAAMIARDPFEPASVRAALVALQDALRQSSRQFDDTLLLALGDLSPAGRAALADSMSRRRP